MFISARVETVSRFINGSSDQIGLQTMCVGGDQGVAMVLERLS